MQTLADTAASYAAQYGGAQSLQYALWQDGEIILTGHAGNYSRTENRALTDDILYGVGSVSKTYTAAAVLKLVDEGKVELDAPVTAYLPDFTMADGRYTDITVRMLLNHSSGLPGSTIANGFLLNDPDTLAADTLLEELSGQTLKAEPGAFSVYCNDGFTLAELVVEVVSGMDFDDYMRQAILEPAGLEDTWFPGEDFDQSLLAKTYYGADETRALPAETVGVHGTGGIYATASDLAAFGGAVFCEDGILSADAIAASMADEYARGIWPEDTEDVVSYGLGWDSVHWYPFAYSGIQAVTKGGDTILYHAGLVVIPEYNMAAAVLSSGGVSTYNEMAASQMLIAALAEQGVAVDQTPHTLPAAERAEMPAELMDYAGLYGDSTSAVMLTVTADGVLSTGNAPLYYYSDGSFRDSTGLSYISFVKERNGQTYLYQQAVSPLPGLGALPIANYAAVKLPENDLSPEVAAAWDSIATLGILPMNEPYNSQTFLALADAAAVAEVPETIPGYIGAARIVDETTARSEIQVPGVGSRDGVDYQLEERDGVLWINAKGSLYMDAAAAPTLFTGSGASYTTIHPVFPLLSTPLLWESPSVICSWLVLYRAY